jgi:hypothetical protein
MEDRRIDNYIFTNAPGYKGYYHALYEKYFNDPMIDKGLQSPEYRLETWDSYIFRIGNMTNPNRDLNALKGLQKIWDMIDIKNIGRYTNTNQIVALSEEIFEVIESNVTIADTQKEAEQAQQSQQQKNAGAKLPKSEDEDPTENLDGAPGKGEPSDEQDDKDGESQGVSGDPEDGDDEGEKEGSGAGGNGAGGKATKEKPSLMTQKEFNALKDAIEKQKKFQDGSVEKDQLDDQAASQMEAISKAEASYANVAKELTGNDVNGCRVLVAKKLTAALIKSRVFANTVSTTPDPNMNHAVKKGMRMGAMLGKKLQVRQEARDTKFTRQNVGKIDRRLIASIGTGLENVFEQTFVTKFNPSIVHTSIDASGSMSGERIEKAITAAVAIAKACSMIENMNCVISLRATETSGSDEVPSVLIAYDSRIDSINKITSLFGHIRANTATPEGLCFEAIMNLIPAGGASLNSYFINFSDGEPGYHGAQVIYSGQEALDHTKKQVRKMREKNIKVISYFIGDGTRRHSGFVHMYGKDAQFIDTDNVPSIAKTMNAKFLEA